MAYNKIDSLDSLPVNPTNWQAAAPSKISSREFVGRSSLQGWAKATPSQKKVEELNHLAVGLEAIQMVAIVIPVTPIEKPVIVIGLNRSKELEILLNLANTKEEVRELIDAANLGNPSVAEFKAKVDDLIEKKVNQLSANPKSIEATKSDPRISFLTLEQTFKRCLSDVVLVSLQKMNDANKKLWNEVNKIDAASHDKASKEKVEERKQAFRKETQRERTTWDAFLAYCGITQALRTRPLRLGSPLTQLN